MNLKIIANRLDPTIEFLDKLGNGSYGEVAKVRKDGEIYAMKFQKMPMLNPIAYEFGVQKSLEDIAGVPRVFKLYRSAFLMEYVDGDLLCRVGKQDRQFFNQLRDTVNGIIGRGYYLARDFGATNLLVDRERKPWVIDFFLYTDGPDVSDPVFYDKNPRAFSPYDDAELKLSQLEKAFLL